MTIWPWRYLSLAAKRNKTAARGFTLMELLVSIVISSIVVSGLLYLVNEVIRVDRREASLENVQRDMQRAMDYMTDELREAVFVYPDPTVVTSRMTTNPGFPPGVPILAFWKPEFLSSTESGRLNSVPCDTLAAPLKAQCQAVKLRQSYYSLVVYFTSPNTATDPNWKGQAKIARYTLPQYRKSAFATTTTLGAQTLGYKDPNNDFINWFPTPSVNIGGDWDVLVDYVDSPTSSQVQLALDPLDPLDPPNPATTTPACSEFITSATDIASATTAYQRSPQPAASSPQSKSFVACISTPGDVATGNNQEVAILLRGNAKTAAQESAAPTPAGSGPSQSSLPTLKSRVLIRGAANKNPNGN